MLIIETLCIYLHITFKQNAMEDIKNLEQELIRLQNSLSFAKAQKLFLKIRKLKKTIGNTQ